MGLDNAYFINGTAYAGKSTLVKGLAQKHGVVACEENYHDVLRIHSRERYDRFLHAGFPVLLRDENRTVEETLALAERIFGLDRPEAAP